VSAEHVVEHVFGAHCPACAVRHQTCGLRADLDKAEATIARVRALLDGRREWGPGQDIEPFRLREALIGPNPDTYDPRCGGCETCERQP
jgi:hypothetical protein